MSAVDWIVRAIKNFWPHTATAVALITALQWPQVRSIFRTINSFLLLTWRLILRKPPTFTGKWLAVYNSSDGPGHDGIQVEAVTCTHVTGNELTGFIKNENTRIDTHLGDTSFFDEVIGHYWPESENNRDIGTFKIRQKSGKSDILTGLLTLYDSSTGTTKGGITYTWYRCPRWWNNWYLRLFKPARAGFSEIEGTGLIANVRFAQGDEIGPIKLGKESLQTKYTILFNGKHFLVEKPWKFLNHTCNPNARIERRKEQMVLIAVDDIFPQTEITCNYRSFDEDIGAHFTCRCPKCRQLATPARL
jgi:hypothetical protein